MMAAIASPANTQAVTLLVESLAGSYFTCGHSSLGKPDSFQALQPPHIEATSV